MNLLVDSFYCYQIMDRSRHTVTKYFKDCHTLYKRYVQEDERLAPLKCNYRQFNSVIQYLLMTFI